MCHGLIKNQKLMGALSHLFPALNIWLWRSTHFLRKFEIFILFFFSLVENTNDMDKGFVITKLNGNVNRYVYNT